LFFTRLECSVCMLACYLCQPLSIIHLALMVIHRHVHISLPHFYCYLFTVAGGGVWVIVCVPCWCLPPLVLQHHHLHWLVEGVCCDDGCGGFGSSPLLDSYICRCLCFCTNSSFILAILIVEMVGFCFPLVAIAFMYLATPCLHCSLHFLI